MYFRIENESRLEPRMRVELRALGRYSFAIWQHCDRVFLTWESNFLLPGEPAFVLFRLFLRNNSRSVNRFCCRFGNREREREGLPRLRKRYRGNTENKPASLNYRRMFRDQPVVRSVQLFWHFCFPTVSVVFHEFRRYYRLKSLYNSINISEISGRSIESRFEIFQRDAKVFE